MSTQRAHEFVKKLAADEGIRNELALATTYDERKAIIAKAGFGDVTLEDVKAVQADAVHEVELSDAELEAVAGGRTASWTIVIATTVVALATVGLIP